MSLIQKQKEECILVVDDSLDNLYLMQFILESEGYKVGIADSGKKALQQVRGCQPNLILLDLMMPQMNGYQVIQQLREDKNLAFIPIFLVTADNYISCQEAIDSGANGLIYKPININELLLEVEKTLESNSNRNLN